MTPTGDFATTEHIDQMGKYSKAIIIGGGPAGSTCAATLKKLGCSDVEVFERWNRGRDKPCGGGLSPRAIKELERLELLDVVRPKAAVIRGAYLLTPRGVRPKVDVGRMAFVIRRGVFDELLLEHAEQLGTRVTTGVMIDRLLEHQGRVVGVGSGDHEWEADVVVLATGARKRLCWDPRRRQRLDAVIARYEGADVENDMMHVYYHRDTAPYYTWLFPEPDGTVNVGVFRMPSPGQTKLTEVLDELVGECFPQIEGARRVGRTRGHPIVFSREVGHLVRPGALRVGEAAWLTDAFTGEGIWHALISGSEAGKAIAAGELHQYEERAREVFDPALRTADRLVRFASTRVWNWALRVSTIPFFGAALGKAMGGLGK